MGVWDVSMRQVGMTMITTPSPLDTPVGLSV